MAQFSCRVGTPAGRIATRSVSAATAAAAREQLQEDGFEIFEISQQTGGALARAFPTVQKLLSGGESGSRRLSLRRTDRVATSDLLLLNQELAALVNAGLPLLKCVDILRTRRSGSFAGSMLDRVRSRVASGDSLSGAFRPEVERAGVPELFVTSLEVGEASGDLVTAIRRYSTHLERSQALRQRVRQALTYPLVLLTVSLIVVAILVTMVIPKFAGFYASSGAELPFFTRVLVGLSEAASTWGLPALALLVAGVVAFVYWRRTDAGREAMDALGLRLPVIGRLRRRFYGLETSRTLSTLLRGGAPLVNALRVTADGTSNRSFRRALVRVRDQVSEGSPLHEALEREAILDSLGLEMVQVGESTGALEEMLEHVASAYDETLERQVQTAVGLMEPAMLVAMGLLVAGILLSLYLPLFRTVQVVG